MLTKGGTLVAIGLEDEALCGQDEVSRDDKELPGRRRRDPHGLPRLEGLLPCRRSLGGSRRRCGWFTGGSGSPATPTTTTGSQPHRHELAICWSGRRSLRPKDGAMRIESSVSSVSWLPLGAVQALPELAFASGVDHYDPPPPDRLQ